MNARRNRPNSLLRIYGRTHPAVENSIHDIDLMLWFSGDRVKRVRGYHRNVTGARHADTFWGVMEFAGGAVGVVETIWLLRDGCGVKLDDAMQVIGDRAAAEISFFPGALSLWKENSFDCPDVSYDPRVFGAAYGALREELMCFCECVRQGRGPEVIAAREAKNAVRVALALVESAQSDREILVEDWN
jgi:UDP-N-acetylglucosamine 3-dehydrogenase